jgi:hypothetical protein
MPVNLHKHDATFSFDLIACPLAASIRSDTTGKVVGVVISEKRANSNRRFAVLIDRPLPAAPFVRRFKNAPSANVINFICRQALAPAHLRETA